MGALQSSPDAVAKLTAKLGQTHRHMMDVSGMNILQSLALGVYDIAAQRIGTQLLLSDAGISDLPTHGYWFSFANYVYADPSLQKPFDDELRQRFSASEMAMLRSWWLLPSEQCELDFAHASDAARRMLKLDRNGFFNRAERSLIAKCAGMLE